MFVKRDTSDEMFYNEYKDASEGMQKEVEKHTDRHFAFDDITCDLYSLFYKSNPEYAEGNIPAGLSIAKQALEQVHECREFADLRRLTRLDAFSAGYATQSMLGTLAKYLPPVGNKSPEDIQADLEALANLPKQVREDKKAGPAIAKREEDLQKLDQQIQAKNTKADNLQVNPDDLRGIMRQALQDASQAVQEGREALAAIGQGDEQGTGANVGLAEKMAVAKRVQNSTKLKEIMQIAGRMVRIARKKQAEKMTCTELSDIERGGDPTRLIGSEYARFLHPMLKLLLMKDIVEKSAIQYKLSGKEPKGKGPIIVCVDSSGSMAGSREYASKGIALAMLEIARMQKRDFAFIQFSGPGQVREFVVKGGKCATMDLLTEMEYFIGGGTCFQTPLDHALAHINGNQFKQADIVFITDDEGSISPHFLKRYEDIKKEKEFSTYGVSVGCGDRTLKVFCDDTFAVSDLLDSQDAQYQERVFKI